MSRGPALAGLAVASLLVVVGGVLRGRAGGVAMVVAALTFPALMLGALARSRSRPNLLRGVIWSLAGLLLAAGLGLRGWSGRGEVVAGLPVSAWLMLGGLVIVPLLLVGVGHAATFDEPDPAPAEPPPAGE